MAKTQDKTGEAPRKSRKLLIVAIILLVIALIATGIFVYRYWVQQQAYEELETYVEVQEEKNPNVVELADLTADWDALRAINPDIVAWIYIPDSPINYPVVQGPDNQKYLHTTFNGETGWSASAGTIFIDQKNDAQLLDRNTFFYGHHMRDTSMFTSLDKWTNTTEFNKHRDVYILTPNGNYYAKMFAAVKSSGSEAIVITEFPNDTSFQEYIQKMLNRSIVEQKGEVFSADQVKQAFAFCTCEYTHNDGRDLFFATVVATTVPDDPWVEYDPHAETGLGKDQSTTFGTE